MVGTSLADTEPTVLVVEDETLVALDIEIAIEDAGMRVAGHAIRGSEAIALADAHRPDLALVDLQLLDGATGIAVAKHIITHGGMVVFMTANRSALPADLAGACGVIGKPFTGAGLVAALRFLKLVLAHQPIATAPPQCLELGSSCEPLSTSDVASTGEGPQNDLASSKRLIN
ncbi:response regulator [Methylobacterium iners]|uniref:Response regulatory domain-containing protein n=1 Tax=Methylobacterium iners TaxID=418707 RepID=A0ABQ4RZE1_9HYPH|nr:hypothetical protein OCOJLMKI_2797 [Methylobacterium iners]